MCSCLRAFGPLVTSCTPSELCSLPSQSSQSSSPPTSLPSPPQMCCCTVSLSNGAERQSRHRAARSWRPARPPWPHVVARMLVFGGPGAAGGPKYKFCTCFAPPPQRGATAHGGDWEPCKTSIFVKNGPYAHIKRAFWRARGGRRPNIHVLHVFWAFQRGEPRPTEGSGNLVKRTFSAKMAPTLA